MTFQKIMEICLVRVLSQLEKKKDAERIHTAVRASMYFCICFPRGTWGTKQHFILHVSVLDLHYSVIQS